MGVTGGGTKVASNVEVRGIIKIIYKKNNHKLQLKFDNII
jgi:hypothetical protein